MTIKNHSRYLFCVSTWMHDTRQWICGRQQWFGARAIAITIIYFTSFVGQETLRNNPEMVTTENFEIWRRGTFSSFTSLWRAKQKWEKASTGFVFGEKWSKYPSSTKITYFIPTIWCTFSWNDRIKHIIKQKAKTCPRVWRTLFYSLLAYR